MERAAALLDRHGRRTDHRTGHYRVEHHRTETHQRETRANVSSTTASHGGAERSADVDGDDDEFGEPKPGYD